MSHRTSLAALAALVLAAPAAAQLDVAIVASASTGGIGNCRFTDPRDKLMATGMFNSVTLIDTVPATPTLAELLAFDSVIVWTSDTRASATAWGDVMADYVDAGGGVVVAVFANSTMTAGRRLEGRWLTGGYETIVSAGGTTMGQAFLGPVAVPGHPVMAGVTSFNGGTLSYRPTSTATQPGSFVIASWTTGEILVAENASWTGRRIDLGFYPPSNGCENPFWVDSTDGHLLMANALVYTAAAGAALGTDACTPAVINSTGLPGELTVTGSILPGNQNVVCTTSDLPPGQFGYLVASRTLGFLPMPGGSQGNLCILGSQARYNAPGQVGQGPSFMLDVGTINVPTNPAPGQPIQSGQTWYWQAWYRDIGGTSNFTNAVCVTFL